MCESIRDLVTKQYTRKGASSLGPGKSGRAGRPASLRGDLEPKEKTGVVGEGAGEADELNRAIVSKIQAPKVREASAGQAETRPLGSVSGAELKIEPGSKVITSFGNIGTVEKMDKEVAEVLVGGMRLRERISNLRLADDAPTGKNASLTKQAETRPSGSVSEHFGPESQYRSGVPAVIKHTP